MRTKRVIAAAAGALVAAAILGGVAYATIPSDGSVFTACMLKNVGTIRLIDPSLPSSNLMSHCTTLETQVSWNQKGQPGAPGRDGDPGPAGPPGAFTGTLASPNGEYSISVTDTGIVLRAPGATARLAGAQITLDSDGATTVQAGTSLRLASGAGTTLQAGSTFAASVGSDVTLAFGDDVSLSVSGATTVQAGGNVSVDSAGHATLRGTQGVVVESPGPTTVNGSPVRIN